MKKFRYNKNVLTTVVVGTLVGLIWLCAVVSDYRITNTIKIQLGKEHL